MGKILASTAGPVILRGARAGAVINLLRENVFGGFVYALIVKCGSIENVVNCRTLHGWKVF